MSHIFFPPPLSLSLQVERHYIMQVTCEATQCKDNQVKVAALQCLVKIVSLYYQYMEPYMGPALFAVSGLLLLVTQDPPPRPTSPSLM